MGQHVLPTQTLSTSFFLTPFLTLLHHHRRHHHLHRHSHHGHPQTPFLPQLPDTPLKVAGVAVIFEVQRSARSEAKKEEVRKQEVKVIWTNIFYVKKMKFFFS
ncbi:hypothetical protein ACB098_03G032300 [Castanea mollissima]